MIASALHQFVGDRRNHGHLRDLGPRLHGTESTLHADIHGFAHQLLNLRFAQPFLNVQLTRFQVMTSILERLLDLRLDLLG